MTRMLTLTFAGRPMLANDRGHWSEKAQMIAGVRHLASLAGRGLIDDPHQVKALWVMFEDDDELSDGSRGPFRVPVRVHAYAVQPNQAKRWIDADAIAPMVKAVLDGLVDAKLLEDDGPRFVRSYHYDIARRGDAWATVIEVAETDGESPCPW